MFAMWTAAAVDVELACDNVVTLESKQKNNTRWESRAAVSGRLKCIWVVVAVVTATAAAVA